MNATVRSLQSTAIWVPRFIGDIITSSQGLVCGILIGMVFLTSLSLVYVKDLNRRLSSDLQAIEATQTHLQTRWGQLLLEQSTWTSESRIQRLAQTELRMATPDPKKVAMVQVS